MKRMVLGGFLFSASIQLAAGAGGESPHGVADLPVWQERFGEKLESGGFSAAYLQRDHPGVVVKLYSEFREDILVRELEAYRMMRKLQDPKITDHGSRDFLMKVLGFFQSPTKNLIVTVERLGPDLTLMQHNTGCYYELKEATIIAWQLARAAQFLGKRKIAHNDIKPDNIMFLADSLDRVAVKLGDFGLASKLGEPWHGGTRGFVPPEYLCKVSDKYLVGKIATGSGGDPFAIAVTWVDIVHPNDFVDRQGNHNPEFNHEPAWVAGLVHRALNRSVRKRISARGLVGAFEKAIARFGVAKDADTLVIETVLGPVKVPMNPGLTVGELKDRLMLATWKTHGTKALRASGMQLLWDREGSEGKPTALSSLLDSRSLGTIGISADSRLTVGQRRERLRSSHG